MCLMPCSGRHIQNVFPPHPQGSQNRLEIHQDPDQDKAVAEDEQKNECSIWTGSQGSLLSLTENTFREAYIVSGGFDAFLLIIKKMVNLSLIQ